MGRDPEDAVLAAAAQFVLQAERRCSVQARAVEDLVKSPASQDVAERMLQEMQQTLALARFHEAFLRTLDEVPER